MPKSERHKAYDFPELSSVFPQLEDFLYHNVYGSLSLDFSNPKAVKALNTAILKLDYDIQFWDFPDAHLCPPIPSRVGYIDLLNNLLLDSGFTNSIKVLDIGTGATCIYPLLGYSRYHWSFVATEVDDSSIVVAQQIIERNQLGDYIELRFQQDKQSILDGILKPDERFSASMCNPPFYKSEQEAIETTTRKQKGLKQKVDSKLRNFSGTSSELWYPGGEKAFLHNYLFQSSMLKTSCYWFTSLVSRKDLLISMKTSLEKLGAKQIKVIDLSVGHKISRVVAWSFLSEKERNQWHV